MDKLQWKQYWREQRISKSEIWKPIEGYEGLYEVSNLGRIKSFKCGKQKILKPSKGKYKYITLSNNLKKESLLIHRLVAFSFITNEKYLPQVNHIDGNTLNNSISNLEWVTAKENIQHAFRTGLKKVTENHHFYTNNPSKGKFGKDHFNSKAVNQYTLDGEFIREWSSAIEIKNSIGIPNSGISKCCNGTQEKCGGFKWSYKLCNQ